MGQLEVEGVNRGRFEVVEPVRRNTGLYCIWRQTLHGSNLLGSPWVEREIVQTRVFPGSGVYCLNIHEGGSPHRLRGSGRGTRQARSRRNDPRWNRYFDGAKMEEVRGVSRW